QTALLAPTAMGPRLPLEAPHGGVQDVGIARIDLQIGRAVPVVDVEGFVPALAAIRGHEHAALLVWPESMPERAHINDVGVLGMNNDGGDMFALFQPHMLPVLAAIGRLVNTVTERDAVAHV